MKITISKAEFDLLSRRNALAEAAARDLAVASRVAHERQGAMNDLLSFFASRAGAKEGESIDGARLYQDPDGTFALDVNLKRVESA